MEVKRDEHVIKKGKWMGRKGFIITEYKEFFYPSYEVEDNPIKINNKREVKEVKNDSGKLIGYLIKEKADIFLTGDAFLRVIGNLHRNKHLLKDDIKSARKNLKKVEENIEKYSMWEEEAKKLSREDYEKRNAHKAHTGKGEAT